MRAVRLIDQTAHRPWSPPKGPWIMAQTWQTLLFAHWPVSPDVLRPLLPAGLALDTYDGQGWIGLAPFRVSGLRPHGLPPLPYVSSFPELNVRTYVVLADKPGVYFFSLDAARWLAVAAARWSYHLPYFHAHMSIELHGGQVQYASRRAHPQVAPAEFTGTYRPTSPVFTAPAGGLADWLTARYCLYTVRPDKQLCRAEIHHLPWPLQHAEAAIYRNTMTVSHGITLPAIPPLLHYAHKLEVLFWPLRRATPAGD